MKKYLLSLVALIGISFALPSFAASSSGEGCDTWGPVTYVYQSASSTSLFFINGSACFITDASARDVSAMSSVLSAAQANGKDAYLSATASGVNVAMQP